MGMKCLGYTSGFSAWVIWMLFLIFTTSSHKLAVWNFIVDSDFVYNAYLCKLQQNCCFWLDLGTGVVWHAVSQAPTCPCVCWCEFGKERYIWSKVC